MIYHKFLLAEIFHATCFFFAVPASVTATDSNADDMIILWGEEATVKALKIASALELDFVSAALQLGNMSHGTNSIQAPVKTNLFNNDGTPLMILKTYKWWPFKESLAWIIMLMN